MSVWISKNELGELIGKKEADILCRTYGGIRFWVPMVAKEKHLFSPLIGFESMCRLCEEYGGSTVVFPNERAERSKQNAIIEALGDGKTVRETALLLGVTERYVYAVANKNNISPSQIQLTFL